MSKLDIAILCGPENGSPKVLAETLEKFIQDTNNNATIFHQVKAFRRLLSSKKAKYNWFAWQVYRSKYYLNDNKLFTELKKKDAVIICDWTPNGFYRETYNIEKLRSILKGVPILYYAVQYLENSPTIIERLKAGKHALRERYDWHLAVSPVTELRGTPSPPWNQIGMNLKSAGLELVEKDELFAIVDFVREGYETYRETQIKALEELNIKYISLEKKYTLNEIREIYKKSTLFFIQFPEAYGLPIAECLSYGSYVLTPDSSWPMSWRLDEKLEVHGPGTLPECFMVYNNEEDLKNKLTRVKNEFDAQKTPKKVFDVFYNNYKTYYEGNKEQLLEVLDRIRRKDFKY